MVNLVSTSKLFLGVLKVENYLINVLLVVHLIRNDLTSFSGQLSTFYLFSIYLDPLIIQGLYKLGPGYKHQFKFENESAHVSIRSTTKSHV